MGGTGLKVSRICLGCMSYGTPKWQAWVLDEEEGLKHIKRAWDLGINFFDTADAYSNGLSEIVLGKALKQFKIPRERVVIATKLYFRVNEDVSVNSFVAPYTEAETLNVQGLSRKHVFEAVEASLKRLQVEYIDLYQIHRWDPNTPIEETMEALHDLVKSGKVRYIGASSMYAWQFAKAQYIAKMRGWTPFVSMQNLYNLIYREEEREMIPLCQDLGVGVIPWSPLARGVLTGRNKVSTRSETDLARKRLFKSDDEVDNEIVKRVEELAKKRGVSMAQIATAWLLSKPAVSAPIVGTTKLEQLEELVAAVKIKLEPSEIELLEEPYLPHKITGGLK